jgi:acetolactate synthase-1/3 small subunit
MLPKILTQFKIMTDIKKHVISIIIDDEFGALARVVELFSARGYNIDSLTVARTHKEKLSRITITTHGSEKTVDLICKLLKRIVPVHYAAELTRSEGYIERELALVQIIANEETRQEVVKIMEGYRAKILDIDEDSVVFEVIGTSQTIEEVLVILQNHGLATVSRTGIAAGFKGKKRLDRD